jgi:hypothetical protein
MILAPIVAALSSVLVAAGIPLVAAQAIVGIGLAAGMYALQRLLTPRQRPPGQEFEAKAGANVPMFCVYGRQKLQGGIMPPVQTGRRVLHVRLIGIDWHDAMEAIVIDGERCRFNGIDGQWSNAGKQFQGGILGDTDPGGDGTHLGDPPWTPGLQSAGADGSGWVTTKEYGNNVKVKFYDGRPVQNADATLVAQSGSDAQGNKFWTADHKGGGVCYAIVDIEPDSNKNLSANPQIEFIVRGRRLWDPRKDTTYGGTGSHSRADKATWEWSDNVALAATDYRLGVYIGGVKMMGIGTPIARIRMDSRIAAANLCDTPRPLLDDEEEPMWRIAAVITNERTHRDNLQIFYDAMAGWETERGGTYRLTAGGPQTPVVAITDADLVKGPRRYKAKKPRSDRYNAVAGKFADPWNAFELQDLPLRTSSEDEAIDGGERLTMTLTLSQVPSQTQAQHLMEIARRRMRLQATATVAVPPRLRDAETMDTVTWASTYHGGEPREFHIQQWKKQRDLTLSWGLVETSPDIWDWDPEADQLDPLVAADLPSAAERLATVAGFAVAASYDVGEGGQKLPVFLCSWTPIADLAVDAVIVRYRPVGATDWSQQRFDTTDTLAAGGPGKVDSGIQAETDYEFEADLVTTPPRYTTVQTPAPVTSDPNHVVKKAIITDTVEPGGVDWATFDPAVSAGLTAMAAQLKAARDLVEQVTASQQALEQAVLDGAAVQVKKLESVRGSARAELSDVQIALAGADAALTVRMESAESAIGANTASIGTLETTKITEAQSLALAEQVMEAVFGAGSAGVKMRLGAVAGPHSYLAYFEVEASITGDDGTYKATGQRIAIYDDGGTVRSKILFTADRSEWLDATGVPFAVFDATTRTVLFDRFKSGDFSEFFEFARAEPGSHENVGTGNAAGGIGNTYLRFSSLGTLTVPENPGSIGDGATDDDYCPVAVLMDITARNTSNGWNGGSYNPMVVAYRLELDDGAGNVSVSREGLCPNYSGYSPTGGIVIYGFGMQQSVLVDIFQAKAGTYNVYLTRRWGPTTANGMQPGGDGAGNGMPLKISSNITILLPKR